MISEGGSLLFRDAGATKADIVALYNMYMYRERETERER